MENFSPTPMLSVEEVATKLSVPTQTIYNWRYRGIGPKWYRLGRHLRCEAGDLYAWLATRADKPSAKTPSDDGNW